MAAQVAIAAGITSSVIIRRFHLDTIHLQAIAVEAHARSAHLHPSKTAGEHQKYTNHEMDNLRAAVEKIPSLR